MPLLLRLCLAAKNEAGERLVLWLSYSLVSTTTAGDVIRHARRSVCERLAATLEAPVGALSLCIRDAHDRYVCVGSLSSTKREVPITNMTFFKEMLRLNGGGGTVSSGPLGGDGAWQMLIVTQGALVPTSSLRGLQANQGNAQPGGAPQFAVVNIPKEMRRQPFSADEPALKFAGSFVGFPNEGSCASPRHQPLSLKDSSNLSSSPSGSSDLITEVTQHSRSNDGKDSQNPHQADRQSFRSALSAECGSNSMWAGGDACPSQADRAHISTKMSPKSCLDDEDVVNKAAMNSSNSYLVTDRTESSAPVISETLKSYHKPARISPSEPLYIRAREPFAEESELSFNKAVSVARPAQPPRTETLRRNEAQPLMKPVVSEPNRRTPVAQAGLNHTGLMMGRGPGRFTDKANQEIKAVHCKMDETLRNYHNVMKENNYAIDALQRQVTSLSDELAQYNEKDRDFDNLGKILAKLRREVGEGDVRYRSNVQRV
uniref:WGS project CAEQ00000000 data, annotated contig 983 n=1 Tax=Trypanosoma congolense (strain IL3000) TaxID=1068625 RepID=F9WK34_TRYCI|nr:unnamed protein product [Trypanosoma congolense IL3000]